MIRDNDNLFAIQRLGACACERNVQEQAKTFSAQPCHVLCCAATRCAQRFNVCTASQCVSAKRYSRECVAPRCGVSCCVATFRAAALQRRQALTFLLALVDEVEQRVKEVSAADFGRCPGRIAVSTGEYRRVQMITREYP
jgi:hypothetical protein